MEIAVMTRFSAKRYVNVKTRQNDTMFVLIRELFFLKSTQRTPFFGVSQGYFELKIKN
jgi:hypothetical protein